MLYLCWCNTPPPSLSSAKITRSPKRVSGVRCNCDQGAARRTAPTRPAPCARPQAPAPWGPAHKASRKISRKASATLHATLPATLHATLHARLHESYLDAIPTEGNSARAQARRPRMEMPLLCVYRMLPSIVGRKARFQSPLERKSTLTRLWLLLL
jgi:hypothetical protein